MVFVVLVSAVLRTPDTAFDFKSEPKPLGILDEVDGAGQPGFDHCLVIDRPSDSAGSKSLVHFATASSDGITMHAATTQPGVQLYTVDNMHCHFLAHTHLFSYLLIAC